MKNSVDLGIQGSRSCVREKFKNEFLFMAGIIHQLLYDTAM